jgi:hypothetical protein
MFVYCAAFILAVDRWQHHAGNNVTCKFVTSLLLESSFRLSYLEFHGFTNKMMTLFLSRNENNETLRNSWKKRKPKANVSNDFLSLALEITNNSD